MDRHPFSRVRALGLVVCSLVLVGCGLTRPLLLPVVGSAGDPGDGGAWDDTDLYLVDPTGGAEAVRLTDTPRVMETDPDLNHDRDEVVYVVRAVFEGGYMASRTAEPDADVLPTDGLPDSGSRWTPISLAPPPSQLIVTNTDGSDRRVVYEADGLLLTPYWSYDGKQIVFAELNLEGRIQVKLINADGSGLQTLGYGSSPSWRKDGRVIVYCSQDDPADPYGALHLRELRSGVIHDLGLRGAGYTNFRAGVSVAFSSPAYSQRNEAVWVLDAYGGRARLTEPMTNEHDSAPVFFGLDGDVVFTRYSDDTGLHELMRVNRRDSERVAERVAQPTTHCFTRNGLWIANHYPR